MQRILIVENDGSQIEAFAGCLAGAGYAVETVSPQAAWAALDRDTPDLLTFGLFLGAAGLHLCRRVKDEPRFAKVVVSAHAPNVDPAEVVHALEAWGYGFHGWLGY